jgi:aminoglycoside phosphotransferase (APT) family kinase protein
VTTVPGIEVDRVGAWLERNVPGTEAPFHVEMVSGGHSNLTYEVQDACGARHVVRRPPLKQVLATAHDMAREHRIVAALVPSPVLVPETLGLCEDESVTGAPFYVMRHVEGPILHDRARAETLEPDARRRAGESLVDVLVELHAVDPDEVGLGDLGRREGYIERQLRRWTKQYEQAKTRELPDIERVRDALAADVPEQGPATIVHGDYKLGNFVHQPTGDVAAVLDWELCTLGDPLADLGFLVLSWVDRPGDDLWRDSASAAEGFPSSDELVARYAARSGRDVSRVDYYVAFSAWRMACIVEGVYARYAGGAMGETSDEAARFADLATAYAAHARERLAG